jgi:hypothetical protein
MDLSDIDPRVIDKADFLTDPDVVARKSRILINPSRLIEVGRSMQ